MCSVLLSVVIYFFSQDYHVSKACVRTLAKLFKPAHHKPRSTSIKSVEEEKKEEPQQKEGGSEVVQQVEEPSPQADEPREEEQDEGQEPLLPPHPLVPQVSTQYSCAASSKPSLSCLWQVGSNEAHSNLLFIRSLFGWFTTPSRHHPVEIHLLALTVLVS